MTQSSARTIPARPGDMRVPDETRVMRLARERKARRGRKLWLVLFAVVLLVVVGVMANLGPLTHYQSANARLDTATAKVQDLKAQKAELQGQLAKLSESAYLETLAREQLTYARPGEDLYIVNGASAKPAGDAGTVTPAGTAGDAETSGQTTATTAAAEGGPALGAALSSGLDPGSQTTPTTATGTASAASSGQAGDEAPEDSRGIFERIISAIRGLF